MLKLTMAAFIAFHCIKAIASPYKIDTTHSNVSFKVKHLVISTVRGQFNEFEGSFDFDPKTGKLDQVVAKINVDSIDTNEPDRDKHLKSADFFGVRSKDGQLVKDKQFILFKSTKVVQKGKVPTQVIGDLTINGITKPVTLKVEYKGEATDPWNNERVGFSAKTQIDRRQFGITWNKKMDKGGVVVGDMVDIEIDGEAVKVKEGA